MEREAVQGTARKLGRMYSIGSQHKIVSLRNAKIAVIMFQDRADMRLKVSGGETSRLHEDAASAGRRSMRRQPETRRQRQRSLASVGECGNAWYRGNHA